MRNKNFALKKQAIYISPNKKSTRIIKTLMDFFFFIKVKIKMVCFSVPSLKAVGGAYDKRKNLFMNVPRSGSSHYTFKKSGCMPITIPKHEPIRKYM